MPSNEIPAGLDWLVSTPEELAALRKKLLILRYENPSKQVEFMRPLYMKNAASVLQGEPPPDKLAEAFKNLDKLVVGDDFDKKELEAAINQETFGTESPGFTDYLMETYNRQLAPLVGTGIGALAGGPIGAVLGSQHTAQSAPQDAISAMFMGAGNLPKAANWLRAGGPVMQAAKEAAFTGAEGAVQSGLQGNDLGTVASDAATQGAYGGGASLLGRLGEMLAARFMTGGQGMSNLMHGGTAGEVPVGGEARGDATFRPKVGQVWDVYENPDILQQVRKKSGIPSLDPAQTAKPSPALFDEDTSKEMEKFFDSAETPVDLMQAPAQTKTYKAPLRGVKEQTPGYTAVNVVPGTPAKFEEIVTPGARKSLQKLEKRIIEQKNRILTRSPASDVVVSLGSNEPEAMYKNLVSRAMAAGDEATPYKEALIALDYMNDVKVDLGQAGSLKGIDAVEHIIEKNKLRANQGNPSRRNINKAVDELTAAAPVDRETAERMLDYGIYLGKAEGNLKELATKASKESDETVKGWLAETRTPGSTELVETAPEVPGRIEPDRYRQNLQAEQGSMRRETEKQAVEAANQRQLSREAFQEEKAATTNARRQERQDLLKEQQFKKGTIETIMGGKKRPTTEYFTGQAKENPAQAVKSVQLLESTFAKTPEKAQKLREALVTDFVNSLQDVGAERGFPKGRLRPKAYEEVKKSRPYLDYLFGDPKATDLFIQYITNEDIVREVADAPLGDVARAMVRPRYFGISFSAKRSSNIKDWAAEAMRPSAAEAGKAKVLKKVSETAPTAVFGLASEKGREQRGDESRDTIFDSLRKMLGGQ